MRNRGLRQEKIEFHRRVRNGYLDLARMEPQRFKLVDAEKSQAQVSAAIESIMTDLLDGR